MSPAAARRLKWAASLLVPLGFLHLLLFVRIPVDLYLASPGEHAGSLPELMLVLGVLGAASLLLTTGLLAAFGYRFAEPLRLVLIALALTAWVVDNFFGRSYPLLNGTVPHIEIDWLRLTLEVALLAGLIYALARWRQALVSPALLFVGLLLGLNAWTAGVEIGSRYVGEPATSKTAGGAAPEPTPFALSPRKNVLIVLMDTFQSDFVDDVFAASPDLEADFGGFVWFTDTLGVAPTTFLSLPAIHSGRYYDPQQPMSAYFNASIRDASFMVDLASDGYRTVEVNAVLDLCPSAAHCVSREKLLRTRSETVRREALHLLDIAFMRVAPEAAKDWLFNGGQFRIEHLFLPAALSGAARIVWDDSRVLAQAVDQVAPEADRPAALFIHLLNTHPPYVLAEDCSVSGTGRRLNREGAVAQAACAILQFTELLSRLREAGLYDQTLIVLAGDHGYPSAHGAPDLDNARWQGPGPDESVSGRLVGSANPLLMIKPPHASGRLVRSDRAASLTDVATTICAIIESCSVDSGHDLFAPEAANPEPRRFMSYTWEHRFWDLGYIPDVTYFEVNGPLVRTESWHRREVGLQRKQIESISAAQDGEFIAFGDGWDEPESNDRGISWRWAMAKTASLTARLAPDPARQVAYQLDLKLFAPEYIGEQAVSVLFNGKQQIHYRLDHHPRIVSLRVPVDQAHSGLNRIELRFDHVVEPDQPGYRTLAASLFSVTLSEVVSIAGE